MKRSIILWQVGGLTFSAVLGTLLHFLYDWTGITILSPVSAVNESTWEHIKILFFPLLFYSIFQYFYFAKDFPEFWCVKLIGILVGIITIPVLFYTYNGAIGKTPDWLNVLIFFIALFLAYFTEYLLFKNRTLNGKLNKIAVCVLIALSVCFIVFTFYPPNLPIFISPI